MEIVYATAQGKKALEERHVELIGKRAGIADQIKVAREFGDLKENAEYDAAREAQNLLETEIASIETMMPNIKVFSFQKADIGSVNVGTRVNVEGVGTSIKAEFVITGILETCIEKGWVSNKSPIGSALLGKKVGDVVEIKVPTGKLKYKIVKISRVD
ncbi:MAG: transcription elongation factor GreA [Firmicutes bacterium]|nr:transcription elongation factor GreA [Bacillota bacterium]